MAPGNLAPGQFGTRQFGTKIVKMDNFAQQFFGMIFIEKCYSRFFCQTLSESLVKSNLFLHSCALQGTQTHLILIFAQDIAGNVLSS